MAWASGPKNPTMRCSLPSEFSSSKSIPSKNTFPSASSMRQVKRIGIRQTWAPLTEIFTSSTGSKIRAVQNTGKVIQEGA